MRRLIIRTLIAIAATTLVFVLSFLLFRNQLLKYKVRYKTDHFNMSHSVNVSYKNVRFSGLTTVSFDSLVISGKSADTLISVGSFSAGIKVFPLIKGNISLRKLTIEHADIRADLEQLKYYFKEFSTTGKTQSTGKSEINLYSGSDRLMIRAFAIIPAKMFVNDVNITVTRDSVKAGYTISNLTLKRGILTSEIKSFTDLVTQTVLINGRIKPTQHLAELSIKPRDENTWLHSPVAGLIGASFKYKSLAIRFAEKDRKGKKMKIEGGCTLNDFRVKHRYLSSDTISFTGCSITFDFNIGENYIELDSLSAIRFGELNIHPYFRYSISPSDSVIMGCRVHDFTVDEFYKSLPVNLFPELKNIEAEGSLSYRAKLVIDLNQPDSLILESNLDAKSFKVKHVDNELYKMNSGFLYTAYEKGKAVRTFQVGPENPNFRKLEEIPALLQRSILLAEDESFFYHNGFRIESIKHAIAQNIKQGRIFRGGSTISQQIIKNVYLSRDKTLSRKLEEIILVWLIESNRLVSKSRMFEVYLNIIEWGPNVYGVNEAAYFYFKKDIHQLNASECIFLASVIPSPKKFYYRFDKEGNLAPYMQEYYRFIAEKMLWRGLLPTANGDSLSSLLKITGPAKGFLRSTIVLADSLEFSESDEDGMEE